MSVKQSDCADRKQHHGQQQQHELLYYKLSHKQL